MADHYYTKSPASAHKEALVRVAALGFDLQFATDAGVFSRDGLDPGSRLLLEALPPVTGEALDLGCGWGAVGALLALKNPGARLTLSDVNERAVFLASKNLQRLGARNAVVVQSDGFAALEGARFDLIATNPPIRAGKRVIYDLFLQSRAHLKPGGRLYLVIRKQQGAPSALAFLRENFAAAQVVSRGGGYWVIECKGGEE